MADYQAITQGVKAALRPGARVAADELADLAAGYASLCREANLRLRRCADYAAQGLNAEAAHLANCQPTLPRLAEALRLADLDGWNELCQRNALQLAPALLIDDLPRIAASTAAERSLRPLLARHRTLAIAAAPVRERLRITRLLLKHDSKNPVWSEQLADLEQAQFAEIRVELERLTTPAERRATLLNELADSAWSTHLPEELEQMLPSLLRERETAAAVRAVGESFTALTAGDLESKPADDVKAWIARWESSAAWHPQLLTPEQIDAVAHATSNWQSQQQTRRAAEESRVIRSMFQTPGVTAAPMPPRKRWSARVAWIGCLMLVVLGGAGYATFRWNPELLQKISSFFSNLV